jgi:hypothetical protein
LVLLLALGHGTTLAHLCNLVELAQLLHRASSISALRLAATGSDDSEDWAMKLRI